MKMEWCDSLIRKIEVTDMQKQIWSMNIEMHRNSIDYLYTVIQQDTMIEWRDLGVIDVDWMGH